VGWWFLLVCVFVDCERFVVVFGAKFGKQPEVLYSWDGYMEGPKTTESREREKKQTAGWGGGKQGCRRQSCKESKGGLLEVFFLCFSGVGCELSSSLSLPRDAVCPARTSKHVTKKIHSQFSASRPPRLL